jgi:hypothetical protein
LGGFFVLVGVGGGGVCVAFAVGLGVWRGVAAGVGVGRGGRVKRGVGVGFGGDVAWPLGSGPGVGATHEPLKICPPQLLCPRRYAVRVPNWLDATPGPRAARRAQSLSAAIHVDGAPGFSTCTGST